MTTRVALNPNFTVGATGLDPYRPWSVVIIDGLVFIANGYDLPKRWDGGSNFFPMGSVAPTDFTLTLSAAGTPAALANGNTATYYLVGYDSTTGKETAPQQASASIANASGSTRDVTVAWTPGSLSAEFDKRRIYRRLQLDDGYRLVATVADATGTYLDATTDTTLRTNENYVYTYRTTLPPRFVGIGSHMNVMFGWVAGTNVAYYAQGVRIDSRFVADDFKSSQILPLGPNDAYGDIVHLRSTYTTAVWYKERARYEMLGSNPSTWEIRRLNGDRGAISQRCVVDIEGRALVLDERGLYWDTPGVDPVVFGARVGRPNPYQPTWSRLNLAVARKFFALHDPENKLIMFFVALDYEPIPNVAIVCDYETDRIVGTDTLQWGTAGGELFDAMGRVHYVLGDDMRFLWEPGIGSAQGVTVGTMLATVTSSTIAAVTASGAAFGTVDLTGAAGTPLRRYNTTTLATVDDNRVQSATGTVLTTRTYAAAAGGAGESVAVGVVPCLGQTPKLNFQTAESKNIDEVAVEHDKETGTLYVSTGMDDDSLASAVTTDLSVRVRDYVPLNDRRCWTWTLQFSQFHAGQGLNIRGVHVMYEVMPGNIV